MLSGIGPAADAGAHGIAVRVDLPGVGRNLQDRYEVCVVNRMTLEPGTSLDGATFAPRRPALAALGGGPGRHVRLQRRGARRDHPLGAASGPSPDLFCMALLARFEGYYPGYARADRRPGPQLPELGHPQGAHREPRRHGALRSADPRDPPLVNFHYFEEGSDQAGRGPRRRGRAASASCAA